MLCGLPRRYAACRETGTVFWPGACVDVSMSDLACLNIHTARVEERTINGSTGAQGVRVVWDKSHPHAHLGVLYDLPNLAITDDFGRLPDLPDAASSQPEPILLAFGDGQEGELNDAGYPLDKVKDLRLRDFTSDELVRLVAAHALVARNTVRPCVRVTVTADPSRVARWTAFLSAFDSPTAVCLVARDVRNRDEAQRVLLAAVQGGRSSVKFRNWCRLRLSVVLSASQEWTDVASVNDLRLWVEDMGLAGLALETCMDPCVCHETGSEQICVSGHCKVGM